MLTPKNVEMSPRAARIYGWLNEQPGIRITTFSTDEDVQRMQEALQAAMKLLSAEKASRDNLEEPNRKFGKFSNFELYDMIRDLEAIMRRLPKNRVQSITPMR